MWCSCRIQVTDISRLHSLLSNTPFEPTDDDLSWLLGQDNFDSLLFIEADKVRQRIYGRRVYLRGLIEFTNYCKNNCLYCGLRSGNHRVSRYRLSKDEILSCCGEGYDLGYRTFVLQGGEDPFYTDEMMIDIISAIHAAFPDCAITLSIGEKSHDSYKAFFDAGARRYLLRHETADEEHYQKLHPASMSLENRKKCLFDLKEIGYQVGSGFMVGSPYQTMENIITDIRFLQKLKPDMIGIGPFITQHDTPFATFPNGSVELTLRLIAMLRLMFPYALIPATTALGTLESEGRELGLKAGANVVMPNLSPVGVRKKYAIYDDKICIGEKSAQCRFCLQRRVCNAGYEFSLDVGDAKRPEKSGI